MKELSDIESAIKDQIISYCNCDNCREDITDADVRELINIVSIMTGWRNQDCSNFLFDIKHEKKEFKINKKLDVMFTPTYTPIEINENTNFNSIVITNKRNFTVENLEYEYFDEINKFNIKLNNIELSCCEKINKIILIAAYDAGYKILPECVLPVMCDIIDLIHNKKSFSNDCVNCSDDGSNIDNLPIIEYKKGDYITSSLQYDILSQYLKNDYVQLLRIMTLNKNNHNIWGKVC